MTLKPFSSFIVAATLLTLSSLLKFFITSSLMVDDNPVNDRLPMLVITGMFFFSIILGTYAYSQVVFRRTGFDLTPKQTKRLAQMVVVITALMAPMLSNDFSIYLAHGNLLTKGILSYTDGTRLQSSDFFQYVSFHWKDCPNYYGPPLLVLLFLAALIGGKSIALSLIVYKLFNTAILFLYIHFAAKYCKKKPDGKYNLLALATLAPVFWIQAAGQAHGDGIIVTLAMLSLYLLEQNKNLAASAVIGIIIACKVMYAVIFLPFLLAVIFFRYRNELKNCILISLKSLTIITLVVTVSYSCFWEGTSTITFPINYHNNKAPANSFTSILTETAIYAGLHNRIYLNDKNPEIKQHRAFKRRIKQEATSEDERKEKLRTASHRIFTPLFKLFGLLLAAFNFVSLTGAKRIEDMFHIFGKILIITVCFYSPIFHPWYLLLPLPFLIDSEKKSWIIWLAVVPALACFHEIKFVIPKEEPLYFYAEALIIPALVSFFLYFRQHFIMEPLQMLSYRDGRG